MLDQPSDVHHQRLLGDGQRHTERSWLISPIKKLHEQASIVAARLAAGIHVELHRHALARHAEHLDSG